MMVRRSRMFGWLRRRSSMAGWLLGTGTVTLAANLALLSAEQAEDQRSERPPAAEAPAAHAGSATAGNDDELARVGEELTLRICAEQCHNLERIVHLRRAAFEWAQMVVDMESRGAKASDEEFATIQQYLTRYYGFVMVNRASAREFSAVLGLSGADAQAIVAHRKQHGDFQDLKSLLTVPGINRAALESQTEALRFN